MALGAALVVVGTTPALAAPDGTPIGNVDEVSVRSDGVFVRGWSWDPDTGASVAVSIDSSVDAVVRADRSRPDVPRMFPKAGGYRGFEKTLDLGPGTHKVCVTAENVDSGTDREYPCKTVTVPGAADRSVPVGNLESVTAVAGGVRVVGWAGDLAVGSPIEVEVSTGSTSSPVLADDYRPDVPKVFPSLSAHHGFDATVSVPSGTQYVCVTAPSRTDGAAKGLGCEKVTVAGSTSAPTPLTATVPATLGALFDLGWMGKEEARPGRIQTVSGADIPGTGSLKPNGQALKFELRAGEMTTTGTYVAPRSEVFGRQPESLRAPYQDWPDPAGSERWYRMRMYVPTSFRTAEDTKWLTVTQWKGLNGGSPPIALEFKRDRIRLGGAQNSRGLIPNEGDMGQLPKGRWTEIVVGMKLSNDSRQGWVEAWLDGEKVIPRTTLATMDTIGGKPDPIYLKQGIYRTTSWDVDHVLYFGETQVTERRPF